MRPLLAPKPPSWSFEEVIPNSGPLLLSLGLVLGVSSVSLFLSLRREACAMPVIFVTVEEALGDLARLKRGERVRGPRRGDRKEGNKR